VIEQLRIRDLGVIVDTTLTLGPGFTAITGETGAGKTMVVTALGLLMGERSDSGTVRSGSEAARVGGLIYTNNAEVAELVDELGGEIEDGDLTLSRTVSAEGRSRATIGGVAAPVGSLAKLADHLFAVHGQSEQLRLRSSSAQREMLDRFGGSALLSVLEQYREVHEQRKTLAANIAELTETRDARAAETERLRAELEDIESVDPQPGEELELKQRIERLTNLEQLRNATSSAMRALAGDGAEAYASDATTLIEGALQDLERVAGADAQLAAIVESLQSLSFQVNDASRALAGFASDLDLDGPGELEAANERLSVLTGLLRRFGDTSEAVIDYGAKAAARLSVLDGDGGRVEQLASQLQQIADEELQLASKLTELRREAAAVLGKKVTAELQQLALPDAEFSVLVDSAEPGRSGADDVQLLLQSHPGASPRPLAKGASGGELSRVMLALEVVVAASDPVPTFVFDEVDAGVGGAAAIEIGRRLAQLAKTSQVIVVTHLAQVAAFANNHLQVRKDSAGGFTESSCRRLDGDERLAEMARLLSGLSDSQSALTHAAELLELGGSA